MLAEQITGSLSQLRGFASESSKTVAWSAEGGPTVEVDFTAVESLGCAFRELRVNATELRDKPFEDLKTRAEQICRRVTYLLEPIGLLELDPESQVVLVRSTPPAKNGAETAYYELRISAPSNLTLRRYTRSGHDGAPQFCDIQVTREALLKLVDDLCAAVPTPDEQAK